MVRALLCFVARQRPRFKHETFPASLLNFFQPQSHVFWECLYHLTAFVYVAYVYRCGDDPRVLGSWWRNYIETPIAFEVLCEEKSIGHLGSPLTMGQWRGRWCFLCKAKLTSRDCWLHETPWRPYDITVIVVTALNSIRSFARMVQTWHYKCCLNPGSYSRYSTICSHKIGLIIFYCSWCSGNAEGRRWWYCCRWWYDDDVDDDDDDDDDDDNDDDDDDDNFAILEDYKYGALPFESRYMILEIDHKPGREYKLHDSIRMFWYLNKTASFKFGTLIWSDWMLAKSLSKTWIEAFSFLQKTEYSYYIQN